MESAVHPLSPLLPAEAVPYRSLMDAKSTHPVGHATLNLERFYVTGDEAFLDSATRVFKSYDNDKNLEYTTPDDHARSKAFLAMIPLAVARANRRQPDTTQVSETLNNTAAAMKELTQLYQELKPRLSSVAFGIFRGFMWEFTTFQTALLSTVQHGTDPVFISSWREDKSQIRYSSNQTHDLHTYNPERPLGRVRIDVTTVSKSAQKTGLILHPDRMAYAAVKNLYDQYGIATAPVPSPVDYANLLLTTGNHHPSRYIFAEHIRHTAIANFANVLTAATRDDRQVISKSLRKRYTPQQLARLGIKR